MPVMAGCVGVPAQHNGGRAECVSDVLDKIDIHRSKHVLFVRRRSARSRKKKRISLRKKQPPKLFQKDLHHNQKSCLSCRRVLAAEVGHEEQEAGQDDGQRREAGELAAYQRILTTSDYYQAQLYSRGILKIHASFCLIVLFNGVFAIKTLIFGANRSSAFFVFCVVNSNFVPKLTI